MTCKTDAESPPAKQSMDYAQLLAALEQASAFDLFRLESVIRKELESAERIRTVKKQLTIGQKLSYFDTNSNSLHSCEIIKLNPKRALVKDFTDNSQWTVPYHMLNIEGADTRVNHNVERGLSRHALSVNDVVGFRDKHGIERTGKVIRLNSKSVTLQCDEGRWRVSYALLYRVLDGEAGTAQQPLILEGDNTHPSDNDPMTIEGTVID
ncbi:hypothetical protein [Endozoicomonas sp. Mp262]|uniref:hypothetical protein n=1 Tax=Endozoicomonas sp. Mp262 TaxID=2919499 RepID=UPI0021D8793B